MPSSSYDPRARAFIEPKSRAGRRRVPIASLLVGHLRALAIGSRRADPSTLVFAEPDGRPLVYVSARKRAKDAWKNAKLTGIGLHAARHTAASVMIAAGVNIKALSEFLGHSSITITLDRYGHLLPGSLTEATKLLDAYLGDAGDAHAVDESSAK